MANALASKFLSRIFKKVGDVVWDLSSGQQGIKDANGVYVLSKEEVPATENSEAQTNYQVSVNPFVELAAQIPAFAIATTIDKVNVGDIVVGDSKILGFVVGKTDKSLTLLDKGSMQKTYVPPKVAIVGAGGNVMVVQNLLNLTGGQQGLAVLQSSILPLLALSGGESKLDSLLPILLMQSTAQAGQNQAQAQAGLGGMNSLLPLLLLSKGEGKGGLGDLTNDPLKLMLLTGGLGGAGLGSNPLALMALAGGDLFGSSEEPTPLVPAIPPLTRTR